LSDSQKARTRSQKLFQQRDQISGHFMKKSDIGLIGLAVIGENLSK
jgi:hypothetical protein